MGQNLIFIHLYGPDESTISNMGHQEEQADQGILQ